MNIKTITLCGSMKSIDRILAIGEELKKKGFEVQFPSLGESHDYSRMSREEKAAQKKVMITRHLNRIKVSDAVLIVNEKQKDIEGYIGANSFLEMGFAFVLNKKIFLLNSVPEQPNIEEILGLGPIELKGNLNLIN